MFCPECGERIPDDARFCFNCGTDISSHAGSVSGLDAPERDDLDIDNTQVAPGVIAGNPSVDVTYVKEDSGANRESKKPDGAHRMPVSKVVIASLVAIAVLVIALVAVPSVLNSKTNLTDDDIKSQLPETTQLSVGSLWEQKDDCVLTSFTIDETGESEENNVTRKFANVTAVYEGSFLKITRYFTFIYILENGELRFEVGDDDGYKAEPIAAISDDLLTSCASSMMKMVDSKHLYKDADGKSQKLLDLYSNNLKCSVSQNNTGKDGDNTVKVAISALRGIRSYSGELNATFSWEDNGWVLSDCTVNQGAYASSLKPFVGTWTGELLEAKRSWSYTCYGGRANPIVLKVKSVNADAQTAVVDLTYTVHPHDSGQSSVDTSPEDVQVTLTDLLLNIKDSSSLYEVYRGDDPVSQYVKFGVTSEGLVKMSVESSGGVGVWQLDTYKLTKTEEAAS